MATHLSPDARGELIGRLASMLSGGELRTLAMGLGVPPHSSWSASKQAIAQDVVRNAEKQSRVQELVDRAKELKPLVEWPAPYEEAFGRPSQPPTHPDEPAPAGDTEIPLGVASPQAVGPTVIDPELASAPATHDAAFPQPALSPEAAAQAPGQAAQEPAQPVQEHAPTSGAGPASSDGSPPKDGAADAAGPVSGPAPPSAVGTGGPASAPFPHFGPGTDAARPSSGVDPKLLILVAGLTLGAAAIAFIAGIVWSSAGGEEARADASSAESASVADLSQGPAGRAARVFDRRVKSLTRVCELPDDLGGPLAVLAGAQIRCGRDTYSSERTKRRPPIEVPGGPDKPAESVKTQISQGGGALPKAPGAGCLKQCSQAHQACKAACGPEPKLSSEYDAFQACGAECLETNSACRLRCN